MPTIEGGWQAFGYIAAYAGSKKKNDRFEKVIAWSIIRFEDDDDPDEIIGQVWDGLRVTEATTVDEEEGFGEFVGYFLEESLADAKAACQKWRDLGMEVEEEREGPPKKKKKNKKKAEEEEEEDEVEEDEGEEEGEEEEGDEGEEPDEEEDEEEDDFSTWEDD